MKAAYRAKGRTDKELRRKEKDNDADSRDWEDQTQWGGKAEGWKEPWGARGRYRIKWKMNARNTKDYGNGFSVERTCWAR